MKIVHKTHGWFSAAKNDPEWEARIEREAELHTARTETAWRKTRRRLERAIEKARAEDKRPQSTMLSRAKLWAMVEARRQELKEIERLAHATPAGSQNRGKGSYRGVTTGEAL